MTRRSCLMLPALAALSVVLIGCSEKQVGIPHEHHAEFEVTLCGLCGDVKEGEHVCKEGAAICEICEKHKGSILCCSDAMNGRRDVVLCRKCGENLLTPNCCRAGIAACPKCGLHKGSPGCCKIKPAVANGAGSKEAGPKGEAG